MSIFRCLQNDNAGYPSGKIRKAAKTEKNSELAKTCQVRATDADVNDTLDRLASVALPFTRANTLGETTHLCQHGIHSRHHLECAKIFIVLHAHINILPLFEWLVLLSSCLAYETFRGTATLSCRARVSRGK